jgi:hypothetical protein
VRKDAKKRYASERACFLASTAQMPVKIEEKADSQQDLASTFHGTTQKIAVA